MPNCLACEQPRAAYPLGCGCDDKFLHKSCFTSLARRLYPEKRETCNACGEKMRGITMVHWRKVLAGRLVADFCRLSVSGLKPVHYSWRQPDSLAELQQTWEERVDKELTLCPEWCVKSLERARKNQVVWKTSMTKWD